eukprot:TRINITY_DN4800_c0_g1_i1.p1 TRINITY_DN4800_c0_g1~~TRINITY_DN4800_c0_g1_i1.p1  ORF type:complete len:273 (+),score=55.09 TRINITY_DN4800_c0_g1_i1:42-860(+)
MSIRYALIARGTTVLVEYSRDTGNFTQIARQLLVEIQRGNAGSDRRSYASGNMVFHYINQDNVTVLCMADEEAGSRIPFAFLQDIQQKFLTQFGRSYLTAGEGVFDDAFARTIDQQMNHYNYSPDVDDFRRIKHSLNEAMDVMVVNIEKVLKRGEAIEVLVTQTETLERGSFRMKQSSTAVKRRMWWKNTYLCLVLICCVLVLLAVVAVILCVVLWKLGVFDMGGSDNKNNNSTTRSSMISDSSSPSDDLLTRLLDHSIQSATTALSQTVKT